VLFFFQAEDGIRDKLVTGVQTCALPISGYIIVGAICERITFRAFLLCELFVGSILYPIFGCWVWGGGWLSQLGNSIGLGHGYCEIGRASCRERVERWEGGAPLKENRGTG